jgi:RimJ/RimL family protein N-acetyltransferase
VIALPDGTAVGNVSTHHCDRRVGSFSYGINTLREHRGRGYASDAIRILLRYFFLELRYQKVTVGIFDFNETSIHLHRRLGFQAEGRLRRMTYGDGRFADMLIFGLLAEEFATP